MFPLSPPKLLSNPPGGTPATAAAASSPEEPGGRRRGSSESLSSSVFKRTASAVGLLARGGGLVGVGVAGGPQRSTLGLTFDLEGAPSTEVQWTVGEAAEDFAQRLQDAVQEVLRPLGLGWEDFKANAVPLLALKVRCRGPDVDDPKACPERIGVGGVGPPAPLGDVLPLLPLQTLDALDLDRPGLALVRTLPPVYWINLVKLDLGRAGLEALPPQVCELVGLIELLAPRNSLVAVPEGLGRLRRLEVLDLCANALEGLPKSMQACTQLQQLRLEDNRITQLTVDLSAFTRLSELGLLGNPLEYIPTLAACPALRTVSLLGVAVTADAPLRKVEVRLVNGGTEDVEAQGVYARLSSTVSSTVAGTADRVGLGAAAAEAFAGKYAKFVEVALRGGYETHALLLGAVAVLAREPGACEVLTAQAGRVELLLLLAQHEALAPVQQACKVLHGLAFHSEFAARLQGPLVANLRKCLKELLGHTDPRRVAAALPILSALAHGCPAAADALVDADLLRAVLRLATAEAHTLPAEGLASPADHNNNQMRAEAGQERVEQEQRALSAKQRGRRPSPGTEDPGGAEEGCQGAALQALGDLAFCPGARRTLAALDPVPRLEALAVALPPATGAAADDGARGRGAAMTSRRMKAVRALAALGENAIVDRLLGKPDRADRGLRVLAIDGGGMKGLVVCVLLRELERRTGRRLHELFDLIGGTSTGGYMACGAGIFKYSVDQVEWIYRYMGRKIFAKPVDRHQGVASYAGDGLRSLYTSTVQNLRFTYGGATYDVKAFEEYLRSYGAVRHPKRPPPAPCPRVMYDSFLDDSNFPPPPDEPSPGASAAERAKEQEEEEEDPYETFVDGTLLGGTRVFLVAARISYAPGCSPYLFRSYAHPTAHPTAGPGPAGEPAAGSGKARMWQGLRSSSAAPYFLEEYQLGEDRFSDGGMAANNPTALALREARHLWPDRPLDIVLSVGTGQVAPGPKDKARAGFASLVDVGAAMIDGACDKDAVHQAVQTLAELVPGCRYFRLDPSGDSFGVDLDETDGHKIQKILEQAHAFVAARDAELQDIAELLLRASDPAPPPGGACGGVVLVEARRSPERARQDGPPALAAGLAAACARHGRLCETVALPDLDQEDAVVDVEKDVGGREAEQAGGDGAEADADTAHNGNARTFEGGDDVEGKGVEVPGVSSGANSAQAIWTGLAGRLRGGLLPPGGGVVVFCGHTTADGTAVVARWQRDAVAVAWPSREGRDLLGYLGPEAAAAGAAHDLCAWCRARPRFEVGGALLVLVGTHVHAPSPTLAQGDVTSFLFERATPAVTVGPAEVGGPGTAGAWRGRAVVFARGPVAAPLAQAFLRAGAAAVLAPAVDARRALAALVDADERGSQEGTAAARLRGFVETLVEALAGGSAPGAALRAAEGREPSLEGLFACHVQVVGP